MSLWQSFRNLQPRTHIFIGVGVMAYSAFGLMLSRRVERKFGMVPTEQDHEELRRALPKIRAVDVDGE
ncbi:hypothetical protein XANCAGTX0491_007136 [Xanthoria calcicola]